MNKIGRTLVATFAFLSCYAIIYWVHVRFFRVDVVFYSALIDVFIASAVVGSFVFLLPAFAIFSGFERFLILSLWLLAGYSIAISVPTVIDRSLSFYILEKLNQRGGSIPYTSLKDVFTDEYVREHHLVAVRVTEQLKSGTVVLKGGCVQLTDRGYRLARFSRFFRRNFLPRKRLLMGEYTDALTDPFRYSRPNTGPNCEKN